MFLHKEQVHNLSAVSIRIAGKYKDVSWKEIRGKAVEIICRKEAIILFCSEQAKTKLNKQLFTWQSSNFDSAVRQKKRSITQSSSKSQYHTCRHKMALNFCMWKEWERVNNRPALTWLLCGLRYGLCALGRIRHLVRHGLGHTVLLAWAGILTRRVVWHLYLHTHSHTQKTGWGKAVIVGFTHLKNKKTKKKTLRFRFHQFHSVNTLLTIFYSYHVCSFNQTIW